MKILWSALLHRATITRMWANVQRDGRPAMCGSMADIQSPTAEIRRGKKERKKKRKKKIEITGQKYDGLLYYIGRP